MSQNQKTLYCSDCGTPLTSNQYNSLLNGDLVLCENCGKSFQSKTIHINSDDSQKSDSKLAEIGLSIKKGTKKLEEGTKKLWKSTKKLGKGLKNKYNKMQDQKSNSKNNYDNSNS